MNLLRSRSPDNIIEEWIFQSVSDTKAAKAPITRWLIGVIIGIFIIEFAVTILFSIESVRTLASGMFGIYPYLAWTLAPVLHNGIFHLLGNVIGLYVVGIPIERHWKKWRFVAFLIITGYGSIAFGAAVITSFSTSPPSFYGTSGIPFALAGYGLTHLPKRHIDFHTIDWNVIFIGLLVIPGLLFNILDGPYFDPYWFNGGHLSGFIFGTIIGKLGISGCES